MNDLDKLEQAEEYHRQTHRPVIITDLKTGISYNVPALVMAATNVGVAVRNALQACQGKRASLKGFTWRFS